MAWQQLDTVRHDYTALAGNDSLLDDVALTTPDKSIRGQLRFTVVNRGAASAYFSTAADIVAGILPAFEIPSGQTRVSPVVDWRPATDGEAFRLQGLLGADCYVTPEARIVP